MLKILRDAQNIINIHTNIENIRKNYLKIKNIFLTLLYKGKNIVKYSQEFKIHISNIQINKENIYNRKNVNIKKMCYQQL